MDVNIIKTLIKRNFFLCIMLLYYYSIIITIIIVIIHCLMINTFSINLNTCFFTCIFAYEL